MKLSQIEWRSVGRAVLKEYINDDVSGLASEMAYNFIFALFPFVIFLSALTGVVGQLLGRRQLFDSIMTTLYQTLPPASVAALAAPLSDVLGQQPAGLSLGAIGGVLLALGFASNGVATIMKAFNRAYGVEETRSFVGKWAVALGLTVVLSLFLIGGFILLLFGDIIGAWLIGRLGQGRIFGAVWFVMRIAGALLGISLGLALLYWQGPNVKQQFRWLTPGAVLTTLVWGLTTGAFGLYARVLGASSYSKYYGTLVGLILFLFYLYLTSTVILLGAELNAETTKRYDPTTIADKMGDPRKQLPGKQPQPHPQAAVEAGVSRQEVSDSNFRSAAKLATGEGSPATATASVRAKHATEAARDGDRHVSGTAGET